MCTLSVFFEPEWGYRLAMNRDESFQRGPASDVVSHARADALRVVYPQDSDAKGTWVGANGLGVSLALLNHHPEGFKVDRQTRQTRGGIIVEALSERTAALAAARVAGIDPTRYLPFTFVAIDPVGAAEAIVSDGARLERRSLARKSFLFASSSYKSKEVVVAREQHFESWIARGHSDLEALHRSHDPERGPFSVCMHREDAQSVSLTSVSYTPTDRSLSYSLGSPCENPEARRYVLT